MDLEKKLLETKLDLNKTQKELLHIKKTVGTLVYWMAQSCTSPIRHDEAEKLINMLDGKDEANDR